jgi:hypothetical protein
MKNSLLFTAAALSSLMMTQVIADTEVQESNLEYQHTFQHEKSVNDGSELGEKERLRLQEKLRVKQVEADQNATHDGIKVQERYKHQEQENRFNQVKKQNGFNHSKSHLSSSERGSFGKR